MAILPNIQSVGEVLTDCLRALHVAGTLKDHRLKDDELISVTLALSYFSHIHDQRTIKIQPTLPPGTLYLYDGSTPGSRHHACHWLSSLIPTVRLQPLFA